ncbi:hypothetical protein EVAR_53781_1 [Eumeta japonica]|uniref:Uncharacterized protein n=1 Tax=Eumeta variegata TaxID=151549 RepID=A0A4C1Z561_EUMVA|nr:hypothetical protein EVAR_53781_1 [Eumeta japonica]
MQPTADPRIRLSTTNLYPNDRILIPVLRKERKTPKEILKTWYQFFRNLRLVYDGQKWARLFQQGRESCEDDLRPGCPVTVVTEENVRK